jgi:hypothetical protein
MWNPSLRAAALVLAGTIGLSACAYDDGYGGYGGVSVGYGSGGYCDPYYGCDSGYGYGYGNGAYGNAYDPWYGWYGGYYYPGIGIYIYDQSGRRYRWNDNYRNYWEGRRNHYNGRDWNDRRWERWEGYRGREDGNRNDGSGRWQNRDDRSSAQPWNERQSTTTQTYRNRADTSATPQQQERRREYWQERRDSRGDGQSGRSRRRGG